VFGGKEKLMDEKTKSGCKGKQRPNPVFWDRPQLAFFVFVKGSLEASKNGTSVVQEQ